MSCDFITDARLQPMIDQFRAHNVSLVIHLCFGILAARS